MGIQLVVKIMRPIGLLKSRANNPNLVAQKKQTSDGRMITYWVDPRQKQTTGRQPKAAEPVAQRRPKVAPDTPDKDPYAEAFNEVGSWGKKENHPTNDIDEIYRLVEESRPEFKSLVEDMQKRFGGEIMSRTNLKRRERVQEKAEEEAREAGVEDPIYAAITDIDGHTLILDSPEDVLKVCKFLKGKEWVSRAKNRFAKPMDTGYRDILLNIKMSNGAIGELQLSTKSMMKAKDGPGHKLYEVERSLAVRAIKPPPMDEKAKQGLNQAVGQLKKIQSSVYGNAYSSSVSRKQYEPWGAINPKEWTGVKRSLSGVLSTMPPAVQEAVKEIDSTVRGRRRV